MPPVMPRTRCFPASSAVANESLRQSVVTERGALAPLPAFKADCGREPSKREKPLPAAPRLATIRPLARPAYAPQLVDDEQHRADRNCAVGQVERRPVPRAHVEV